jgi:hypothetical protein
MALAILPIMLSFMPSQSVKPVVSNFKYKGDIAPIGYFDPLKISNKENVKYLRESELQHGRIAMLATLLIPGFEMMDPSMPGIKHLSSMDLNSQLPFWYGMAVLEFYRMYTGWTSPFYGNDTSTFTLKEDYQPGNLIRLNPDKVTQRKYNTELSNGRLAMLAAAHMVGSELATGQTLAQQLSHF